MASAYPTALDTLPTNKTDSTLTVTDHAAHHNNIADAVNKIEAELGINPSGSQATTGARFAAIEALISGASGVTNSLPSVPPILYDHVTGVDGTAPNSALWSTTIGIGAGALIDMQSNRLRFRTGATGGYSGNDRVIARAAPTGGGAYGNNLVDGEILFRYEWPSVTGEYYFNAALRSTNDVPTAGNYYYLGIGSTAAGVVSWEIGRYTPSVFTSLGGATVISPTTSGTKRWFRFRVQGSSIYGRTWPDGTAEPTTWDKQATDATYTAGGRATLFADAISAAANRDQFVDQIHVYALP